MKDARFEMRLARDLLERVDVARGSVSRAAFVTGVLEQALGPSPVRAAPEVAASGVTTREPERPAPARASEPLSPTGERLKQLYERQLAGPDLADVATELGLQRAVDLVPEVASEQECSCGGDDRPMYTGRDKLLHCGLCDGLISE